MATPPFDIQENKPGDQDVVSQFPPNERLNRDVIESWLLTNHGVSGNHTVIALDVQGSDPAAAAGIAKVYSKTSGGRVEAFARDSAGGVSQITKQGSLATFPAGTKMLFVQTTAPLGWTKDTDQNNKALRIVSGTAGVGGATAFSSVFGAGKATASHTLTIAQMPAHDHDGSALTTSNPGNHTHVVQGVTPPGGGINDGFIFDTGQIGNADQNTSAAGGHTHSITGTTGPTGGGTGHTHDLSLDLQFVDVIKATKD